MNDKFFPEFARRLKREGIDTGPVEKERLPVLLDGQEVMAVAPGGTIFLKSETADDRQVVETYDTVAGISAQVYEYTEAMASAPPLTAEGLHEGFRLLADFNGVVLAGQELERGWGYKFVTWARNPDRTAVAHGHYYRKLTISLTRRSRCWTLSGSVNSSVKPRAASSPKAATSSGTMS